MKIRRLKNNKGISLLEVLISMIVLTLGVLGLAPMMVLSVEGNVISRDNSIAANLAKEAVEFYEGMDSIPGVPIVQVQSNLEGRFNRRVSVRDNTTDSLVPAGVYQVDVRIGWTDHQNVGHSTTYSTFVVK